MRIPFLALLLLLFHIAAHAADADQSLADAIRDGDTAGITKAIQQGARVNSDGANTKPGLPPLTYAILTNRTDTVVALLKAGADPNLVQRNHQPIFDAANANTQILKLMLEAGANPNIQTALGYTPLHRAAGCRPQTYASLAKQGGYSGEPPDCEQSVRLLITAKADIDAKDRGGKTPLMTAVFWNNVTAAKLLLEAGAAVETKDPEGHTPLILALNNYATEQYQLRNKQPYSNGVSLPTIELLLQYHANPNVRQDGNFDDYHDATRTPYSTGYTPLTLAARHGWLPVAKLLLKYNADTSMTRSDGLSPVQLAQKHGHKEIVNLIQSYQNSKPANQSFQGTR